MVLVNQSSGNGPSLPSVLTALPMPAQLTLMRSGPSDSARSSAWLDGGLVGDVGGRELHAVAELAQFVALPQVDDHHAGARVEQSLGGRQAEARRTAGDDCYGVFDLHGCIPFILTVTADATLDLPVGWDYTQSRSTASVSAPGTPGGVGVGGHAAGEPRRGRRAPGCRRPDVGRRCRVR